MSEPLERARSVRDVNLRDLLALVGGGAADPLEAAGAAEWVALDGVLRGWNRAAPAASVAFELLDGHPAPVVSALLACHRDGYVREAALRRLIADGGRHIGPILALRAADPVDQVRAVARRACFDRIEAAPLAAFEELAPTSARLGHRREGAWLAARLDELLRAGPPEVLAAGLAATDGRVRRLAHAVAIDAGLLDVDELIAVARSDRDQAVRIRCGAAAVQMARRSGDVAVLRALLDVRAIDVRVEAVFTLIGAGADDVAWAALDDENATVRSLGRAALVRAGGDPAAHYRAVSAGGAPPVGAIAGLGEVGTAADAPLVREWLTDGSARRRAEAVRALRRLGVVGPELFGMLDDPSGTVTRQVAEAVIRAGVTVPAEELLVRVVTGPWHVRTAAHRVLRAQNVWVRLIADLRLLEDPEMADRARSDVLTWMRFEAVHAYSQPDPAQSAELAELLQRAGSTFSEAEHRHLRFHFGLTR